MRNIFRNKMLLFGFLCVIFCIVVHSDVAPNFVCMDGSVVNIDSICNGQKDCADGSDETKTLCYRVLCPKEHFRCGYGACIPEKFRCDGKQHCADNSDENTCNKALTCKDNKFRCGSGECISPEQLCDGVFDCMDDSDENGEDCVEIFCPDNAFQCKYGGCVHLDARCDGFLDCIDGSDESTTMCENFKRCNGVNCSEASSGVLCPPIIPENFIVNCEGIKGGDIPCDKPVPVGTIANYFCEPFYQPAKGIHKHNYQAVCQEDGTWNREIVKCKPECGLIYSEDMGPMMVHGWDAAQYTPAWHATIYALEMGNWTFRCGGSLISQKAILTAGHCAWKTSPNQLKIATGKYYSEYRDFDSISQVSNVSQIILHPLYQDLNGDYGSDIAVMVLKTPVELGKYVLPVCIDWTFREYIHMKEDTLGVIFGMGLTENDTFSDSLRGVYLPVISDERCIKEQRVDFRKYVRYTSFCAGWKNGTGVCNGDSGSGLVFQSKEKPSRWIIQGIVSISPRRKGMAICDPSFYTIFTKVSPYVKWLRDILFQVN